MQGDDDASSNPLNAEHLPVGGETSDEDSGEAAIDPDINDDYPAGEEDESLETV